MMYNLNIENGHDISNSFIDIDISKLKVPHVR